jgi:hypothetical protein
MISPCKNKECTSSVMLDPQMSNDDMSNDHRGNHRDSNTFSTDAVSSKIQKNMQDFHNEIDCCIDENHGGSDFLLPYRSHPQICHGIMQCLTWCHDIEYTLRHNLRENCRSFQDWKVRIEPLNILLVVTTFITALVFLSIDVRVRGD